MYVDPCLDVFEYGSYTNNILMIYWCFWAVVDVFWWVCIVEWWSCMIFDVHACIVGLRSIWWDFGLFLMRLRSVLMRLLPKRGMILWWGDPESMIGIWEWWTCSVHNSRYRIESCQHMYCIDDKDVCTNELNMRDDYLIRCLLIYIWLLWYC